MRKKETKWSKVSSKVLRLNNQSIQPTINISWRHLLARFYCHLWQIWMSLWNVSLSLNLDNSFIDWLNVFLSLSQMLSVHLKMAANRKSHLSRVWKMSSQRTSSWKKWSIRNGSLLFERFPRKYIENFGKVV